MGPLTILSIFRTATIGRMLSFNGGNDRRGLKNGNYKQTSK